MQSRPARKDRGLWVCMSDDGRKRKKERADGVGMNLL